MGELVLGNKSYCYAERRGTENNVIVGNYTSIGCDTIFDGGFQHNVNYISTYPFHSIYSELKSNVVCKGDIILGSDVWIGERCTIMSGISVGHGAIIGTNSIVTKDVPPYAVMGGVPAKIIRYRYDQETINKLLLIRWWDWSDEKIRDNLYLLQSDDIRKFIDKHYSEKNLRNI